MTWKSCSFILAALISGTRMTEGGRSRKVKEFDEELGIAAPAVADWIELGSVKQKGGKTVHAWAFEGDWPADFVAVSNTFEMEWPPRSGRIQKFPEIDRAEFFPLGEARKKINEAQITFLDRLLEAVERRGR
jgi:predicted NUDIX family NTP pyrophosphohydrolase